MEARAARTLFLSIFCICVLACSQAVLAASYRTTNFVIHAPTEDFARRVGDEAERFRKELAIQWAGQELPPWSAPCPIRVKVGQIGAGGATTFSFHNGEVFGWNMNIQGTEERILDSVLPHEITHTILACRFRRPLPRWADEGISTLVEHESERRRQTRLLGDVMRQGSKIPLRSLVAMTEYPPDMRDVMKLYAQGYSVTDYLVQQGGRETFLQFLNDAMRHGGWDQALSAHYGVNSVDLLESKWNQWVLAGSPAMNLPAGQALAVNDRWKENASQPEIFRAQSPDGPAAPSPVVEQSAETQLAATAPVTPSSAPRFSDNTRANARGSVNSDSAPLFTQAPRSASPTAPVSHQAARTRENLLQPLFSTTLPTGLNGANQLSRNQLQLTREEFQPPATPLARGNAVQPFSGGGQTDPFVP